jgi:Na+/H+ antiporter NhaD/arsenite permease-like protein
MPVSIFILFGVLLTIAVRKIIKIPLPIWAIMTVGALICLLTQQIAPMRALHAIDIDIILYLFGAFIICQAAEASGYLEQVTDGLFYHTKTGTHALLIIVFALGIAAAVLMNDTIAIVGTPIILQLCKVHKNLTKPLLLALAFSITIGSVMTPIGNPQNLLIAIGGDIPDPFYYFIKVLALPTFINLIIAYGYIYVLYGKVLRETIAKPIPSIISDQRSVWLVKFSLQVMIFMIIAKITGDQWNFHIHFYMIALIAALPILFFNKHRWKIVKTIDWGTIVFFISMFILMQSVWDSQFFQNTILQWKMDVTQISVIMSISVLLSQLISNVPMVALYLPLLTQDPQHIQLLALAAGSTIAGNLSILGAASNIIILQNAEKRGNAGFGALEFTLVGLPLVVINIVIYLLFL